MRALRNRPKQKLPALFSTPAAHSNRVFSTAVELKMKFLRSASLKPFHGNGLDAKKDEDVSRKFPGNERAHPEYSQLSNSIGPRMAQRKTSRVDAEPQGIAFDEKKERASSPASEDDVGDSISQVGGRASVAPSSVLPSHFCGIEWADRPVTYGSGGKSLPTEVHVVLALNRVVVTTKDSQEFLTVKAALEFYWTDTRLAGFPEKASIPADIWRPELTACSGLTVAGIEDYAKTPTFDMKPNSRQDGLLKLVGNLVLQKDGHNLSEDLERMRAFPFDGGRVDLSMAMFGNRRRENFQQVQLAWKRPNLPDRVADSWFGEHQHINWHIPNKFSGDYEICALSYGTLFAGWNGGTQHVAISIHLKRSPGFYVLKGIFPLYATMMYGMMTFFIDASQLGSRMSQLTALFLTCFAIQWVILERLPRLPFLTILDHIFFSSVLCLFIIGAGNCAANIAGNPRRVQGFDYEASDAVDYAAAATVFAFVHFFTIGYRWLWQMRTLQRRGGGADRTWSQGKEMRNKLFSPVAGQTWRLAIDNHFVTRAANKVFLGMGSAVESDSF